MILKIVLLSIAAVFCVIGIIDNHMLRKEKENYEMLYSIAIEENVDLLIALCDITVYDRQITSVKIKDEFADYLSENKTLRSYINLHNNTEDKYDC